MICEKGLVVNVYLDSKMQNEWVDYQLLARLTHVLTSSQKEILIEINRI